MSDDGHCSPTVGGGVPRRSPRDEGGAVPGDDQCGMDVGRGGWRASARRTPGQRRAVELGDPSRPREVRAPDGASLALHQGGYAPVRGARRRGQPCRRRQGLSVGCSLAAHAALANRPVAVEPLVLEERGVQRVVGMVSRQEIDSGARSRLLGLAGQPGGLLRDRSTRSSAIMLPPSTTITWPVT